MDGSRARHAGTVHLGGGLDEIVANERAVHRGVMPERPFVLVGQQYLADPTRSVGNIHPVWTYAHVPHAYAGDATEAIIAQIERFAPGFRERIIGTAVRSTTEMSVYNPNYVGGDIIGGASSLTQLLFRPRFAVDPYFTGIPGTYLCSASTPPGAGAHGMCGANAAGRLHRALERAGLEPRAGSAWTIDAPFRETRRSKPVTTPTTVSLWSRRRLPRCSRSVRFAVWTSPRRSPSATHSPTASGCHSSATPVSPNASRA